MLLLQRWKNEIYGSLSGENDVPNQWILVQVIYFRITNQKYPSKNPLKFKVSYGFIGKSHINVPFSIAMLDYWMVFQADFGGNKGNRQKNTEAAHQWDKCDANDSNGMPR